MFVPDFQLREQELTHECEALRQALNEKSASLETYIDLYDKIKVRAEESERAAAQAGAALVGADFSPPGIPTQHSQFSSRSLMGNTCPRVVSYVSERPNLSNAAPVLGSRMAMPGSAISPPSMPCTSDTYKTSNEPFS